MNTGLGSLTVLKASVLPEALRARTSWDAALKSLGLGVVAQMERHCARKFQRTAADTHIISAACLGVTLPRYPIEGTPTVAFQSAAATTWDTQAAEVASIFHANGVIEFSSILGAHRDQLRITYTGGYWWDTTEDATGTQPVGSALIPDDLVQAWILQVQAVAERSSLFKALGFRETEDADKLTLQRLDLIPDVISILRPHIRHAI